MYHIELIWSNNCCKYYLLYSKVPLISSASIFLGMQFVHDGRESSLLSLCKNSENFLKSFFVKVWKSNRAIWLDENFLGHNSGTRIFLDMQFVCDGRESSLLSSCKNSENSLQSFFAKVRKTSRAIWLAESFLSYNSRTRILLDMQFVCDGKESSPLSSCKNSENSLQLFFVKVWKSNQAIWLVESFLGHNSRTRIFLDKQFVCGGRESSPLSSCKNSENSLKLFFVKVWKSNRAIWLAESFLGHNLRTRIFLDM